jgi:hypothetical protein
MALAKWFSTQAASGGDGCVEALNSGVMKWALSLAWLAA